MPRDVRCSSSEQAGRHDGRSGTGGPPGGREASSAIRERVPRRILGGGEPSPPPPRRWRFAEEGQFWLRKATAPQKVRRCSPSRAPRASVGGGVGNHRRPKAQAPRRILVGYDRSDVDGPQKGGWRFERRSAPGEFRSAGGWPQRTTGVASRSPPLRDRRRPGRRQGRSQVLFAEANSYVGRRMLKRWGAADVKRRADGPESKGGRKDRMGATLGRLARECGRASGALAFGDVKFPYPRKAPGQRACTIPAGKRH